LAISYERYRLFVKMTLCDLQFITNIFSFKYRLSRIISSKL